MPLKWFCKGCGEEVTRGVVLCESCEPAWTESEQHELLEHLDKFSVSDELDELDALEEDAEEEEWDRWAND